MNLNEMMDMYAEEGLTRELAAARVCQDVVLKAISIGPLNRNVTIKGGVVMRSITNNNRRATRDIDLDFIHYSISDESIRLFVEKLNCIEGLNIAISSEIKELKHQDYHGKSIEVTITDDYGNIVSSKIDIGVHKDLDVEQEEYCFDVCMDENGASLLKNTVEQAFTEKLRSLLIFGSRSRRYKDIYDMYYLRTVAKKSKILNLIDHYIFSDEGMRENTMQEILERVSHAFGDKQYLRRVDTSRQRWMDDDIKEITDGIVYFLTDLAAESRS